jgi:hypothetical protein
MLHNTYLPEYHFNEEHSILISASPSRVYQEMITLEASQSWIVRLLLFLRGIPSGTSKGMEGWKSMGFVLLEQQLDREVILGLIGQFWKVNGKIQSCTADEFIPFHDPEFAKATWNFEIITHQQREVVLKTETRIYCKNEKARKKFKRYWFFIRPFSGLIRIEMLKSIKRKAEGIKT